MRKFTVLTSVVLLLLPQALLAGSTGSIGDAAVNLLGPTEIITKLALIACYIVGVALILVSFAQYKIHLQSPKLVPLTTPVLLLVLGIITVFIPYASENMFGESASAAKQNAGKSKQETVLPLPDINQKGPVLPIPKRSAPLDQYDYEDSGAQDGYYDDSFDGTDTHGGHWAN